MKIKDLKKYFKLETGEILETAEKMLFLWEPARNKTECRIEKVMCGAFFSTSIPVVATADSKKELENNDRKSD